MNKKIFALSLLALLSLVGCSSTASDTGDSGITQMPATKSANTMPGNPNIPAGAKAGIPTPGK